MATFTTFNLTTANKDDIMEHIREYVPIITAGIKDNVDPLKTRYNSEDAAAIAVEKMLNFYLPPLKSQVSGKPIDLKRF